MSATCLFRLALILVSLFVLVPRLPWCAPCARLMNDDQKTLVWMSLPLRRSRISEKIFDFFPATTGAIDTDSEALFMATRLILDQKVYLVKKND